MWLAHGCSINTRVLFPVYMRSVITPETGSFQSPICPWDMASARCYHLCCSGLKSPVLPWEPGCGRNLGSLPPATQVHFLSLQRHSQLDPRSRYNHMPCRLWHQHSRILRAKHCAGCRCWGPRPMLGGTEREAGGPCSRETAPNSGILGAFPTYGVDPLVPKAPFCSEMPWPII